MSALPEHPCYVGNGEFDHEYEIQDESFDHEYGTEQIYYWLCKRCGKERDVTIDDYYNDDIW